MRMSTVQKDILLLLYDHSGLGNQAVSFSAISMFTLLNQHRARPVPVTDFRRACHKLLAIGLVEKYRDEQSQKVVFRLSAEGKTSASLLYCR
ncbi:chromosome segregation protein ParM [Rouxiella sp. WC2420]|uniref:Chromosome segregation protein ParM n=1 Tax=Rouxiella sp. WC2420 TaxID=3234145 RepID=A0AB39VJZ9_9GAMM